MKKLLVPMALLLLFLAGCSGNGKQPLETVQTEQTEPAGIYVPGSAIETQTSAAVTLYEPAAADYYGMAAIGDHLLLISGEEQTCLSLYSGMACSMTQQVEISADLRDGVWQLTDTGFAYYDAFNRQAVFLDSQLSEFLRVDMPQEMQGLPAFSSDGSEVFYCAGQEIRGLDVERGISRLIKSHACASQTLKGVYFDGKLLECEMQTEDGKTVRLFISSENGQSKGQQTGIQTLYTYENRFCAQRLDGTVSQFLMGTDGVATAQLNTDDQTLVGGLPLGGALGYSEMPDGLQLRWYDLESGKKTVEVLLPETGVPTAVWADRWSGSVWLLVDQTILRWHIQTSAVLDETSYLGTVFTAESPDELGLDGVQERVDDINDHHGISIRIWKDAVQTSDGHTLEMEYQVVAFEKALDQIEPVLSLFPEKFLRKSVNNKLRICLVRSVAGEDEAIQFWNNGNAYIILPIGADLEQQLLLNLGYIVDVHALGNSPMLDDWESLNPEGVGYSATVEPEKTWLEGENRVFADAQSVVSVADDRARIFWYAVQADNGEMFQSPVMQAKLLLMCQAIRDAWRLERSEETFLWEQYLQESIAYVK